jgi:hypothetical protein
LAFGTDYPYPRDAISIAGLRQLESTPELDATSVGACSARQPHGWSRVLRE